MTQPFSIAIAGLGTVGSGVLALLARNGDLIAARAGRPVVIAAVSARDRLRDRGVPLSGIRWYDDPEAMVADPSVDAVVELIGGADGVARQVVQAAIAAGKPVVTANKALLALHGVELAAWAEQRHVPLAFEAAVAGGIPVIKLLREGLAGNRIERIAGILNGTCNFILTTMREGGGAFADVLAEAQRLGYAEADPSFDIDGIDAAHKLAILAALAFGRPVSFESVHVEGIRCISPLDVAFAAEFGFRIKLLGLAQQTERGIAARVHPCLVPEGSSLAGVEGVFNAVVAEGDFVGRVMIEGRGAGAGPTASAVVADVIDVARGRTTPVWGAASGALSDAPSAPMSDHAGCYYLRIMVTDRPGVIADVTAALRDEGVSLESMLQRGRAPGEAVPVVLVTHETNETHMGAALARIALLDAVQEAPTLIRIEQI